MKKYLLVCLIAILCLLSGCHNENSIEVHQEEHRDVHGDMFYNPYTQKMVIYDKELKAISLLDDTRNQFQFWINGSDDLFSDGNSLTDEFRIIQAKKSQMEQLYTFNTGEGVFPIGIVEDKVFFIHTFYAQDGKEDTQRRCISVFDLNTSNTQDYSQTSGLISYGAVSSENIYYTIYNDEQDSYTLMKVDATDFHATPEILRENVTDGTVLVKGNQLFYVDGTLLTCDQEKYEKESVNLFYHELLIQFYIDQSGLLCIKVTDTQTKDIFEDKDICGIRFNDGDLFICKLSGVIKYESQH